MKDFMRKGFSLLLFDCNKVIASGQINDGNATFNYPLNRWLLIYHYWFKKVPSHFAANIFLALLIVRAINPGSLSSPAAVFVSVFVAFLLLILSLYIPLFAGTFLPEFYTLQQKEYFERSYELEKCKKAQLPNPTLVLIWYALDKTSGINSLKNDNAYTELLTQIFGIDQRSIKSTIDLFWGSAQKRNKLQGRARTEIENRFSEAYRLFEALHFEKATLILKELELKCFSKKY